jgi:hypothetical protein
MSLPRKNKKPIKTAKLKQELPEYETQLKTKAKILSPDKCGGFFVKSVYIENRKPNTVGSYVGWVPGAGGDLWWVKHKDSTIACYLYTEVTDL